MNDRNSTCPNCGLKNKHCQGHKAPRSKTQIILALLSLVGALGLLVIAGASACDWALERISQRYQAWPEKKVAAAAVGKTAPEPPIFGEVLTLPEMEGDVSGNSELSVTLRMRLQAILVAHPDSRVRVDLRSSILNAELYLSFGRKFEGEYGAAFGTVAAASIKEVEGGVENGKIYPVLYVDVGLLADLSTRKRSMRAMLVIGHEGRHFLQWRSYASGTRESYTFSHVKQLEELDETECALRWRNEREAYQEECIAANSWGNPEVLEIPGLCAKVADEAAFSQYLFWVMTQNAYIRQLPMCVPTWAREAGHPHPWAYKKVARELTQEHLAQKQQ